MRLRFTSRPVLPPASLVCYTAAIWRTRRRCKLYVTVCRCQPIQTDKSPPPLVARSNGAVVSAFAELTAECRSRQFTKRFTTVADDAIDDVITAFKSVSDRLLTQRPDTHGETGGKLNTTSMGSASRGMTAGVDS